MTCQIYSKHDCSQTLHINATEQTSPLSLRRISYQSEFQHQTVNCLYKRFIIYDELLSGVDEKVKISLFE
jgi:hypothetical protein